jgi:Rrf2 family protein
LLSQTSEYALRAVLYLAMRGGEGPVKIDEIAGALEVPRNYLSKTLHQLARAGVLSSGRGKHGGFRLGRPAEEMTLGDVVLPFEPAALARRCLLGEGECSDETACAAHARWKRVAEPMLAFFHETTVAALVEGRAGVRTGDEAHLPVNFP